MELLAGVELVVLAVYSDFHKSVTYVLGGYIYSNIVKLFTVDTD